MAAAAARLKPISFQPHFLPSTLFPLSNPMRSNSDGANKTGEAEWREADALEKKIPLTVPMHVSKLPPVHSKLFLCASNAIWSSPPFAVSLVLFFDENGKTRTVSYWCGFGAVTFASLMSINAAALLR